MKSSSVIDEIARRNPHPVDVRADATLSTDARATLRGIISIPRDCAATSSPRPRHVATRSRRIVAFGVVAVVAASCLALAGVFSSPPLVKRLRPSHPNAVAFLDSAVRAAIAQPALPSLAAGQYYYEKNLTSDLCQFDVGGTMGPYYKPGLPGAGTTVYFEQAIVQEEWSAADGSGQITRNPSSEGHFLTAADEAAWKTSGSPNYCTPPGFYGTQGVAAPAANNPGVSDLPSDPTALGALIAAGRVNDAGEVSTGNGACPSQAGDAPKIYASGAVCSVSAQFDIANNLLDAPEGPQIIGPALYSILAKLPGVEDIGAVTDAFGRTGTGIEDPSTGYVFVIDPGTGQLLEHEELSVASTASPKSPVGTVRTAITYGPVSVVNGLGAPAAGNTGATGIRGAS